MRTTVKTHQLSLMSFSSSNSSDNSPSQNLPSPPHYCERPTVVLSPDEATFRQIQRMVVYTTNIVQAILMFNPSDKANDSNKEQERCRQILHVAVQVFHNNDQAGDTTLNILDSSPQVVCGCILIMGQNDQAPQTMGGAILHSIV
jgi:hypothetical protein